MIHLYICEGIIYISDIISAFDDVCFILLNALQNILNVKCYKYRCAPQKQMVVLYFDEYYQKMLHTKFTNFNIIYTHNICSKK